MRVCVTADFHGFAPPAIPDCDVLLFAGDLGDKERFDDPSYTGASAAYPRDYKPWLNELHERGITPIGIAGNHDFGSARWALPWTYLQNDSVKIQHPKRLKIWGSPLSPTFMRWAHMASEEELAEVYARIPEDVDVIVSHGPPYLYCDRVSNRPENVGSRALLARIKDLPRLKLVACGHIHEGYGVQRLDTGWNEIAIVNGSYVNERYEPGNAPIVVDL